MRVLFTCRPLAGHYDPLLGLAAAAVAAGHDVAFATGPSVAERARADGYAAFAAGEERLTGLVADRMPGPEVLATDAGRGFFFAEVFAGLELAPRAAGLDRVIATWRPDVVVHEIAELAAPLAATAAGVPYATSSFGPLVAKPVLRAAAETAAPHWRARGLAPDPLAGAFRHLYLDVCPPRLQVGWIGELPAVQAVRPASAPRPGDDAGGPGWLGDLVPEQTVYVTFGTVWNRDPAAFRAVLDALAGEGLDLIVTVGSVVDPATVDPGREGVRVERFVPQAQVLPHCAAVVCHGGAGTVLGALGHGRPVVVLPQAADQFSNGERVAAAGAGLALGAGPVAHDALRDAVRAVLRDASYRRAAEAVAAEIAAMPSPGAAIDRVVALAG